MGHEVSSESTLEFPGEKGQKASDGDRAAVHRGTGTEEPQRCGAQGK